MQIELPRIDATRAQEIAESFSKIPFRWTEGYQTFGDYLQDNPNATKKDYAGYLIEEWLWFVHKGVVAKEAEKKAREQTGNL